MKRPNRTAPYIFFCLDCIFEIKKKNFPKGRGHHEKGDRLKKQVGEATPLGIKRKARRR